MANGRRGFFRDIILRLDREAARQVREDTEDALEAAGQAGAAALEEAMQAGGQRAARALVRELSRAYDQTIAEARVKLAKGLIDRQEFERIRTQAAQTFDRGLLAGIERLRSAGQLTDTQFARLANRLKMVGDVGAQAATRAQSRFRALGTELQTLLSSRLTQFLSFAALTLGLRRATEEADKFESATAQLSATARFTGVGLRFLQDQAAAVQEQFKLGAEAANGLTAEVIRLTSRAQAVEQTGAVIAAFLDLGAARRLSTEQTLQAVRQAILGIDEGTDKLFGANPSVLYAEFAAQIGKSAGALTDEEKALALVNAALEYGGRVRGEYATWLETAQGRQQEFNRSVSEFAVVVGQAFRPVRELGYTIGTWLAERGREFIGGIQILGAELGAFFYSIPHRLRLLLADGMETLAGWIDSVRGALSIVGIDVGADMVAGMRENASRARTEAEKQLGFLREGLEETKREIVEAVTLSRRATQDTTQAQTQIRAAQRLDLEALEREVAALSKGHALRVLTAAEMARALELERQVADALARGNVSLEDRITLAQQLQALQEITPQVEPPQMADTMGVLPTLAPIPLGPIRDARAEVDALAQRWLEVNADMVGAAERAAMGISGAFQDAFSILIQDFGDVGEAAEAMARGVAGALVGGVADYASSKVSENVALAIEATARALAAASNPFTAGLAPGYWAAAKTHALAAAKWAVLAGAAGAGQAAIAGGGRGGLSGGIPTGARDTTGRLLEERRGPEVHIYIDPLDPANPAWQRSVYTAQRYALQRYGDGATVHVHPRTGGAR